MFLTFTIAINSVVIGMKLPSYKAQSLLEYVMTYGWALLVIGVIVVVLAQLGVFSNSTYSAGALPGSCQIIKLSSGGPSLTGNCNGQTPKFVASFQQIGGNSSVVGPAGPEIPNKNYSFSEFAWINTIASTNETVFSFGGVGPEQGISMQILGGDQGKVRISMNNASVTSQLGDLNNGGWHFVGFIYQGNTNEINILIDGLWTNETLSAPLNLSVAKTYQIGRGQFGAFNSSPYYGQISNVQLYSTALSGSQALTLYLDGIGAVPVDLNNIVGWWPLNGDANDYSGESQDGTLNNVTFLSNWMSTYSTP